MVEFVVDEAYDGQRADMFVASKYTDFSRSSLENLFENDFVKINSKPIKASKRLKAKQRLNVDEKLLHQEPPKIKLRVLHEDKDIIVIDKPAGVLTHNKGALNYEPTVANFIRPKVNNELRGNRAGIVHRLDRGTSGVIIAAKNQGALKYLQKQFSTRKVKKIYLAVVEGTPKHSEAVIDVPIGRNPQKPQTFKPDPAGKPAQTRYRVIKSFTKKGQKFSLLELNPETGRTHQLRVHAKYIGHPIAGDSVYGRGENMLLHARSLELQLPGGKKVIFKADAPDNFKNFINE